MTAERAGVEQHGTKHEPDNEESRGLEAERESAAAMDSDVPQPPDESQSDTQTP